MKKTFMKIGLELVRSEWIMMLILLMALNTFWQVLELATVGEIQPSAADSIIAWILAFSLYGNYKQYKYDKELQIVLNKLTIVNELKSANQ